MLQRFFNPKYHLSSSSSELTLLNKNFLSIEFYLKFLFYKQKLSMNEREHITLEIIVLYEGANHIFYNVNLKCKCKFQIFLTYKSVKF